MAAIWVVPSVVLLVGLALAAVLLARLESSAAALRLEVLRVEDTRRRARALRAATVEAQRRRDGLCGPR